jgi:hypothetical protein
MPKAKVHIPPDVGSQFSRRYKGISYTMTVVQLQAGAVGYSVDGRVHTSPSTAAKSITGSHVNGWQWWGIERGEPRR